MPGRNEVVIYRDSRLTLWQNVSLHKGKNKSTHFFFLHPIDQDRDTDGTAVEPVQMRDDITIHWWHQLLHGDRCSTVITLLLYVHIIQNKSQIHFTWDVITSIFLKFNSLLTTWTENCGWKKLEKVNGFLNMVMYHLFTAFFFCLLLICIDLLPAPQFCCCQKGEGALQYTILFLFSYRGGNEKQMAPLSRTWARPGGRALKHGVKLKRLRVHIPGQWQPLCLHSCGSQEIRGARKIRGSIGWMFFWAGQIEKLKCSS